MYSYSKMVEISRNPNITVMAYSEIEHVDGYVGNFQVQIRKKAHYVDQLKCTGCGECAQHCPVSVGNEFDLGLSHRKAIYIPFPQAVPGLYTIDMEHCIKCGICASTTVCEPQAINFDDQDEIDTIEVGTIIVATGYDPIDVSNLGNYGYGRFENVITGLEMERNLSSTGPNLGHPVRPSDGTSPSRLYGFNVLEVGILEKVIIHTVAEFVACMRLNKPGSIRKNILKLNVIYSI